MPSITVRLLLESEQGCLMVRVPAVPDAARITDWVHQNVAETDLAGDGYENDAHVTVAFGFAPDVTPEEVSQVVRQVAPNGVDLRLGQVSFFSEGYGMWAADLSAYDVLKVDVESQGLSALHYALRSAFGKRLTVTYPEFHSHLTLAYIKKGCCRNLEGNASFAGWTFHCPTFVYSTPNMASNYVIPMEQTVEPVSEPAEPVAELAQPVLAAAATDGVAATAELALAVVESSGRGRYSIGQAITDVVQSLAGGGDYSPTTIRCAINDALDAADKAGYAVNFDYDQQRAVSLARMLLIGHKIGSRGATRESAQSDGVKLASLLLEDEGDGDDDLPGEEDKLPEQEQDDASDDDLPDPEEQEAREAYEAMLSDLRTGECAIIQGRVSGPDEVWFMGKQLGIIDPDAEDRRRSGQQGQLGVFASRQTALRAIKAEMERQKFFPDVYYVNERGNVDLLSGATGKSLRSWV